MRAVGNARERLACEFEQQGYAYYSYILLILEQT